MSVGVEQDFAKRTPAARAWAKLRTKVLGHNAQLRLCLRVTVAAVAAFILAQIFTAPLAGLWAVLTAVLVTQMSLGASVTATIEYFVGTLGGAIYAGAVAVLIPHHGEISLLIVIALAVAPLAFLAAVNPHFRVGPFTAILVVLGATATHIGPLESAFYRVMEVALGGVTGLVVSLLVLPARAQGFAIEAAADMLDQLARALALLAAASVRTAWPRRSGPSRLPLNSCLSRPPTRPPGSRSCGASATGCAWSSTPLKNVVHGLLRT